MTAGAAFLAAASPFVVQRLTEHPDAARRLGVYAVSRLHPFFLTSRADFVLLVAVFAAGIAAFVCATRRRDQTWSTPAKHAIAAGLVLCTAGFFAMPLTCVLAGKMTQPYHFPIVHHVLCSYFLLLLGAGAASVLLGTRWTRAAGIAAALAACAAIVYAGWNTRASARAWEANEGEQATWDELTDVFAGPEFAQAQVLGTFNFRAYSWWTTFKGGFAYCPDAFTSTLPDAELEERVVRLIRMTGMERVAFERFIHDAPMNTRWIGHDKYQASRAHTFAPLEDYDDAARERIARTGILSWSDSWHIELPTAERDRLLAAFDGMDEAQLALAKLRVPDVILLDNSEFSEGLAPSSGYTLARTTTSFRVWLRRGP
ncbi:MAG TPA: hypothetical protein VIH35_10190 [Kiritimatiellia bacterium]